MTQADDPYRYSQHQPQVPGGQYPYYAGYQQMYAQQGQPQQSSQGQAQGQQYQAQYPGYYQSTASTASNGVPAAGAQQMAGSTTGYPDYSNYSRMNYVQGYTPVYGQTMMGAGGIASGTSVGSASSALSGAVGVASTQGTPVQMSNVSASGIGQVQPVGSRPRVTTTMWEDEKTLCYQVDANNVSVVRRADNNMINGTKLLNVAHMTRGRRDGILKSEKVRDVVKIGSMHLKGVWIPFERALAMAQREGIVDLLYPLFVRDIKQVIQQGSTTQPQQNPQQWGYQQSASAPTMSQSNGSTGAPAAPAAQAKQSNSPYMTPNSLASASNVQDSKTPAGQQSAVQPPPQSQQTAQQTAAPQQQQQPQQASQYSQQSAQSNAPQPMQQQQSQQNYYGYPYYPQYQYGYGYASTGANTTGSVSGGAGSAAGGAGAYQYPQSYNYGYMPQYQAPQYDDQKDK